MGPLATQCPHCRVKIQLKNPDWAGKNVECPRCSEAFVVQPLPAPATPPVATAPAATKPPAAKNAATAAPNSKPASAKKAATAAPSSNSAVRNQSAASKAPAGDIDFPIARAAADDDDDDIVEADEFMEEPQADDDWLTTLDSLAPKAATGSRTSNAPAPVAGRLKKKKSSSAPRRRSLRDPDGEFPLWLQRLIMIGTGTLAGAICMIIWASIIYRTGRPSSFMAMFIGASVGTGVRLGASKWDFGWFPAISASLIALLAIFGGKIYGISAIRTEAAREFQAEQAKYVEMLKHPNYAVHLVANDIETEMAKARRPARIDEQDDPAGIDAGMPAEMGVEDEFEDYGSDLYSYFDPNEIPSLHPQTWNTAVSRWKDMPDPEKATIREQISQEIKNATVEPTDPLERHARIHGDTETAVLSIGDFIFAAIALVIAFRIAAGFADAIGQNTSPY
ncbi:MAG: hypothetical protein U0992_17825 [Planctomycetaceae bacterium]